MTPELALKHVAISALFYVFYQLILSKTTFHAYSRLVLLLGLVISLLPLFGQQAARELVTYSLPTVDLRIGTDLAELETQKWNWFTLLYTSGLMVALAILVLKLGRVLLLFRRSERGTTAFSRQLSSHESPCSFLFWSFIPAHLNDELQLKVEIHEKAHVRLWHTLDVILLELIQVFFWFNPVLFLMRRAMVRVHEYQADLYTHRHSMAYTESILEYVRWKSHLSLTSDINPYFVHLKHRINMLHQTPTKTIRKSLLLFLLPIMAASLTITACEKAAEVPLEMDAVDKVPEFNGGQGGLIDFMSDQIVYPESEKEHGTEETIIVRFTVEKDGSVTNGEIMRGENENLKAVALEAVKNMPKWVPGTKDGKEVPVKMMMPIRFKPS